MAPRDGFGDFMVRESVREEHARYRPLPAVGQTSGGRSRRLPSLPARSTSVGSAGMAPLLHLPQHLDNFSPESVIVLQVHQNLRQGSTLWAVVELPDDVSPNVGQRSQYTNEVGSRGGREVR